MVMEIQIPNTNKKLVLDELTTVFTKISIRSESKINLVGSLNKSTKEFRVFRDRDKHLHIRTNSYGFNEFLIQKSKHINIVIIEEENNGEHNTYKIPRADILSTGTTINWIDEAQIFVSLDLLTRFYKMLD